MSDPTGNHTSSVFRSMNDLSVAITAARSFGMRDITVTTVYHPASESTRGDYIAESVEYHLDCAMLGTEAEFQRQLAHLSDVRSTLEAVQG